jgi:FAD-dependent urate hydroxylase
MRQETDVAIIGAGPYGLSLANTLRARGVSFRIFGPPMKFWRDMPEGVNLKSLAFATSIYGSQRGDTFDAWSRRNKLEDFEPCTMASFATYGEEMQKRYVPEVEPVLVTHVVKTGAGFEVTLENGAAVQAKRVIVATGLSYLARVPEVVRGLPGPMIRHTSTVSDYSEFKGKSVAVIGGGASAVEAGALVLEGGGTAEVFVRDKKVTIHGRTPRERPLLTRLRQPWTVLGPGPRNWVLQNVPLVIHFLPPDRRAKMVKGYLGPASPWWIKDRVVGKVPMHTESEIIEARAVDGKVALKIRGPGNAERTMVVDHVIAGTGYVYDTSRLPFLDRSLQQGVQLHEGAPLLDKDFQSSVPGLYFTGHLSAMSFGPLFRFVAGAEFTADALARHLAGRRPYWVASAGGLLVSWIVLARQKQKAAVAQPS